MGFGLWIDSAQSVAWAAGTHEYRPLGTAVVSVTDLFRPRDFNPGRRRPESLHNSFAGFFGSLEEVNGYLCAQRSARRMRRALRQTPPTVR